MEGIIQARVRKIARSGALGAPIPQRWRFVPQLKRGKMSAVIRAPKAPHTTPTALPQGAPMRLYDGLIPTIAQEVARTLIDEEILEVDPENKDELELDIQAVLREYRRTEREIIEAAKDISARDGSYGNVHKIKRRLARERNFRLGDESLEYIIQQLIETFLHTAFVDEVYGEDRDIRRLVTPILRKHMSADDELDQEVRSKIKNLEEGSRTWDIEYEKALENLKRNRKIE